MSLRKYINNAPTTTISGAITNASASFTVGSLAGFPASYPYTVSIDLGTSSAELVLVTGAAGSVVTVTRNHDGQGAFSHADGATFDHVAAAIDHSEANTHINTGTGVHGLAGTLVDTTTAQTISGKTLSTVGNPALVGKSSVVTTGKSLQLQSSAGVEKLSVDDLGNLTAAGAVNATLGFKVFGTSMGTASDLVVFTAGGTWTKPSGLKGICVRVVGGGGGGGGTVGAGSGRACGAGGGAGGYSEKFIPAASLGATETVTIGAGGAGHSSTTPGDTGGTSSFGAHCSATGGVGGTSMSATTGNDAVAGGAGGAGSGGNVNCDGAPGTPGIVLGSGIGGSGTGGSSVFGGGARARVTPNAGFDATGFGGGGGGSVASTTNQLSGSGSAGVVIVEEIYI